MSHTPSEMEIQQIREEKAAARKRFMAALKAAKHRFAPGNLRDELVDNVVDTALEIGDKGVELAKRNKGKLAIATTAGAAFLARRSLIKLAKQTSQTAVNWWQSRKSGK